MKRQSGHKKIKREKIDYAVLGQALRTFCTPSNDDDLSENGPFGQSANSLSWSNSMKNRKYLKLIWANNRGNVRDTIKDHSPHIITQIMIIQPLLLKKGHSTANGNVCH